MLTWLSLLSKCMDLEASALLEIEAHKYCHAIAFQEISLIGAMLAEI